MNDRRLILAGLSFVVLAIIFGVSAAHYLERLSIPQTQIEGVKTASNYLFFNGLGLLVLSALLEKFDFEIKNHYRLIFYGMLLFAGSILLLTLLPVFSIEIRQYIWPITPIGGFLMFLGWLTILIKYAQNYKG